MTAICLAFICSITASVSIEQGMADTAGEMETLSSASALEAASYVGHKLGLIDFSQAPYQSLPTKQSLRPSSLCPESAAPSFPSALGRPVGYHVACGPHRKHQGRRQQK